MVSSPTFMFADDTKLFILKDAVMIMQHFKMTWIYFMNESMCWQLKLTSPSVSMHTLDQYINLGHII